MEENYLRIIDANLNRLREGIRVIEDIFRYVYNDKINSSKLKQLRHKSKVEDSYFKLLSSRNIKNDVLKQSISTEQKRKDLNSIIIANFKRAQESARVLEEFFKLTSVSHSENFKSIRYELYDLEMLLIKKY